MIDDEVRVRPAELRDVEDIDALIRGLAEHVREPDAVEGTPQDLAAALFAASPRVFAHVAELPVDGELRVVGMALWFITYSTWRGRHGIWLEDIFVDPEVRGGGVGRRLMETLAEECVARGYARVEWAVLDWNTGAQGFYHSLGAVPIEDLSIWRLEREALDDVATT